MDEVKDRVLKKLWDHIEERHLSHREVARITTTANNHTVLNRECSEAIYVIDTGCYSAHVADHFSDEGLGGRGEADATISVLTNLGLIEHADDGWLRVKWKERNIKYNKKHERYVYEKERKR